MKLDFVGFQILLSLKFISWFKPGVRLKLGLVQVLDRNSRVSINNDMCLFHDDITMGDNHQTGSLFLDGRVIRPGSPKSACNP